MMAVDMVSNAGFQPVEASSADEAIAILETRNDMRIVFTDINMKGSMDGLKLAHAVRGRWPPIKIVITSAWLSNEKLMPTGSKFIPKPYEFGQLSRVLQSFSHDQS
jgi:two-component system, response regulator PdtaR